MEVEAAGAGITELVSIATPAYHQDQQTLQLC
jgi:hypothetical protein